MTTRTHTAEIRVAYDGPYGERDKLLRWTGYRPTSPQYVAWERKWTRYYGNWCKVVLL